MSFEPLLTTKRTYLLSPDHLTLEQVNALDMDPEVMRYITSGKTKNISESEAWLQAKLEDYKKHGFGLMPAYLKAGNEFIGWGGIKHLDNTPKIEVGYRLAKAHWGQGLATEITHGLIDYARKQLNLKQLVAVTDLDNIASQRVLQKCDFQYKSDAIYYKTEVKYFELDL